MPRDAAAQRLTSITGAGLFLLATLWAIRIPSIVVPMGGDQGLYAYVGQRAIAGDVLYRDAWDQKPPGIEYVYGLLWRLWPHESVVAGADVVIAGVVAALLVLIGRRLFSLNVGIAAASVFLLFGNPSLERLDGVYVRSQCETFIALFAALAIACVTRTPGRLRLAAAGTCLAVAFWLKYPAAIYILPLMGVLWQPGVAGSTPRLIRETAWIIAGFTAVCVVVLGYFAMHGALLDLKLATIDYNLRYSSESYATRSFWYPVQMLIERAGVEAIWFIGGIGALLLALRVRDSGARVALLWLTAGVLSIAINGARNLPQYFVQAHPALALAGAAGVASLAARGLLVRAAVTLLLAIGLIWRVGDEGRGLGVVRWSGLPGALTNFRQEVAYLRGDVDRASYLSTFGGQRSQDKFNALAYEQVANRVQSITAPTDRVLVFGFASGSILVKSQRESASRFILNRAVVMEFAAEHPGYGSAGLYQELLRTKPAAVVLQKQDWGPVGTPDPGRNGEPNSADFFHRHPQLEPWLLNGYTRDLDTPEFEVWRRRS